LEELNPICFFSFDSIESALDAIKRGEMVIVMDDEDRENEGDLIMAAEFATAEQVFYLAFFLLTLSSRSDSSYGTQRVSFVLQ
jgi:hypothetical protein